MKYLENLDEIYKNSIDLDQGTIYLYLWLYDNELHKNIYNTKKKKSIYEKLLESYENIHDPNTNINSIYQTPIKDKLSDKKKDLYYIYYKFYKLKNDEQCKSNSLECAKQCETLHSKYKLENCNNHENDHSCPELDEFWKQNEEYIKKILNCNGNKICILYFQ
ncbi:hypothetical protein PVNG_05433 [Plasmodium vivax North Korean]|uniref:Uncharacterized protein n=1 Tax=Plasmodium vivax North Korean TaxID=1035514 RepID=A0A0J9W723_PLAVI|nr:hypothetical protein PVNG_05433 [Plasmodium vivax North Korean]